MEEPKKPNDSLGHAALELSGQVGANVIGALIALKTGTPTGALTGAGVGAALQYLADSVFTHRWAQAEQAVAIAAAEANLPPDELVRRVLTDPHRRQLAAAVMAAAMGTALEEKIRVLGRLLATGALAADDTQVDEQRVIVETLADLEELHIRVLWQISQHFEGYGNRYGEAVRADGTTAYGWRSTDLEREQPGLSQTLSPLLSALERHDLILNTAVGGLDYVAGRANRWAITDYGRLLLALLKEHGEEEPKADQGQANG